MSYDAATNKAVLVPSDKLERGVTYRAVVGVGARDLAGNALDQDPTLTDNQPKKWSFKIVQTKPCRHCDGKK